MKLSFGDVLLARFPFTDLSSDKRRPVVVLSINKIATLDRSVIAGRLGTFPDEFIQRHAALFRSQFGFHDS